MALNPQEQAFLQRAQSNAHRLADEMATAQELAAVYYDREYAISGSNELSDEDLAAVNITAAQLAAYVNLCGELANLRDNQPVTQSDWGAALNQVRTL